MAEPFTFKINNPEETGESIARKLNGTFESVDVSVIRDAVSRSELINHLSSAKSEFRSSLEDTAKRNFNHIEATYARTAGSTRKMNDLRYHGGGTQIAVQVLPPANPKFGDLWFDIS